MRIYLVEPNRQFHCEWWNGWNNVNVGHAPNCNGYIHAPLMLVAAGPGSGRKYNRELFGAMWWDGTSTSIAGTVAVTLECDPLFLSSYNNISGRF